MPKDHKFIGSPFSILLWSLLASNANPDDVEPVDEIDTVQSFLEENVIGRTLETRITSQITGSSLEAEFHRRTHYQNLIRTPEALSFDVVFLVKQKNYDLDENGKRLDKPPQVKDRNLVIRYSVRQLKSSGTLVGLQRVLTNSLTDPTGAGSAVQMSVKNSRLILTASTPLYSDHFAAADKLKTGASKITNEFWTEDQKLKSKIHEFGYDVDPETLERTPSGHDIKFEEVEIDSLW